MGLAARHAGAAGARQLATTATGWRCHWSSARARSARSSSTVRRWCPRTSSKTCSVRLDDDALRLESAVLFGDVRAVATVEERRRLAREIHDGIAQEIASLGYLVDDLARDECSHNHQPGLVDLRDELTRVVTELRLSIFDLRSGVSTNAGLGSVLADYVREIGKGSGMAVHTSLEESRADLRTRRRDRAAPHRPRGDHERPQTLPGNQPLGDLPGRTPVCRDPHRRRRSGLRGTARRPLRPAHHERACRPHQRSSEHRQPSWWRHRCLRRPTPRRSPLAPPRKWRKPCPTPCCSSMTTT